MRKPKEHVGEYIGTAIISISWIEKLDGFGMYRVTLYKYILLELNIRTIFSYIRKPVLDCHHIIFVEEGYEGLLARANSVLFYSF